MTNTLATTDKQAIGGAFWMTTRVRQERDLSARSFPHQRYKTCKLRPTSTESPDTGTLTMDEARRFLTSKNAKQGAKQVRGNRENETSCVCVNDK